ncbi:MAG: PBP1A family penicillin-binding protein [Syntrophomonas sp.]
MFATIKKAVAIFLIFIVCFFAGAWITLATPEIMLYATGLDTWEYHSQDQTIIYDRNGQEITRIGYKRIYADDFPEALKQAVVAVEDRRFYEHASLDPRGITRALYNDIKEGNKSEGGSTITQQLARTLFLTQEKTVSRKFKELMIAIALEEKYGKDSILNMYLNEVYMGRGCSGMASAANIYFGKKVNQLNEAEIAMLVGMLQAPEYYSPDSNMEGLKTRQEVVLNVLAEQGLISTQQAETTKKKAVKIKSFEAPKVTHPYLMNYLNDQIIDKIGKERLYQGGLKVHTSIDLDMQKTAESKVVQHAKALASQGIGAKDIAMVSIDPDTGGIRALVGGVDWDKNQYNMALLPRQPGSAIKPLYYAAAMEEDLIKPDTQLNNKPRSFNGYTPQNDQSSAPETVTVRLALLNSYNVASVEVLNQLGLNKAFAYLKNCGITTLKTEDKNLALALGGMTSGISPIQMASAYAMYTNGGVYYPYFGIDTIEDDLGKVLFANQPWKRQVMSADTASTMDAILKDVVKYGTGKSASFALPSGGKTGTTTQSKDLWFVGYTDELVTAVWVGNSDNSAIKGYDTYGGRIAAPLWRDYMVHLYYNGSFKQKPPASSPKEETPEEPETPVEPDKPTNPPIDQQPGPQQPKTPVVPDNPTPSPEPKPWPNIKQPPNTNEVKP